MFTGIIKTTLKVKKLEKINDELRLWISKPDLFSEKETALGSSIAINGVCLTVESNDNHELSFFIMHETLKKSNLGLLNVGDVINLETPLKFDEGLDGHFVLGHVDGTVKLEKVEEIENSTLLRFSLPTWLNPYIVKKGSVCINGISLTVSEVNDKAFEVNIIPFTKEHTNILSWPHDEYNVEIDYFAKMIESYLAHKKISDK